MFCSACGSEISEGNAFCTQCGRPVAEVPPHSELQKRGAAKASTTAAGAVTDVPWWLGWLGVVFAITLIGIPLYALWAYNRGKRVGIGSSHAGIPGHSFGWSAIGWGIATLLPIIGWYAIVHLPTMCYKQGLAVGSTNPASGYGFSSGWTLAGASVALLLVGVSTALAAALLVPYEDDGSGSANTSNPTRRPMVTTRPANFTENDVLSLTTRWVAENTLFFPGDTHWVRCIAADYRSGNRTWVVTCEFKINQDDVTADSQRTYLFDDATGTVE